MVMSFTWWWMLLTDCLSRIGLVLQPGRDPRRALGAYSRDEGQFVYCDGEADRRRGHCGSNGCQWRSSRPMRARLRCRRCAIQRQVHCFIVASHARELHAR